MRGKYFIFVFSSHRAQQLTLVQNCDGYKEHAVISNTRFFPGIGLFTCQYHKMQYPKITLITLKLKKIKGQAVVQAVRPLPVDAKARVQFHANSWGIYDDDGQWTVG